MPAKKRPKIRFRVGTSRKVGVGYTWAYTAEQAIRYMQQRWPQYKGKRLIATREDLSPGRRRRPTAVKKGAKRAARKTRANPGGKPILMSRRLVRISYRHIGSAQSTPYTHNFKPGDEMWAMPDGSIVLRRGDGKPFFGEYMVPDSE